MQNIPILGSLIIAGGIGYVAYRILSDHIMDARLKAEKFGKMFLVTGCSISGAAIGTILGT